MEVHEEQQGGVNGGKNISSSNFLCRQSSTRWTPTTDQIRILKDLYYNNGVRSPTAEQIQRISAKLRQYGKIEGKNVFYWFQNHKARERQKKRFTTDHLHYVNIPNIPPMHHNLKPPLPPHTSTPNGLVWNISNMSGGGGGGGFPSSSSSPAGYVGNYGGCGSLAMEKSFRECSITAGAGVNVNGGSMGQSNIAWVGVNEYPYYPFLDKKCYNDQTLEIEDEEEDENTSSTNHEIETLPLFPMHGDNAKLPAHVDYINGWLQRDTACPRASLELTLSSCFTNFNN